MIKRLRSTLAAAWLAAVSVCSVNATEQSSYVMPVVGPMSMATFVGTYLNPGLRALATCSWGTSAPANGPSSAVAAQQCWWDTSGTPYVLKWYIGGAWVAAANINASTHAATIPTGVIAASAAAGDYDATQIYKGKAFGGRLTLTTAVPALAADVTAAATIYYSPYVGDLISIYDGTRFVTFQFTELSLALDSASGHTGYHQSGKNFDLFVINDSGTVRLATGPAWSSDTARGTGAGTTELTRVNGIVVNANTLSSARFGSSSGNTVSVSANRATYVGTFRASADGQTQVKFGTSASGGGQAWIGLWNNYNRVRGAFHVRDSTASWTYAVATYRAANNSTSNSAVMVRGFDEDAVTVTYSSVMDAGNNVYPVAAVGLDATNAQAANSANTVFGNVTGLEGGQLAKYSALPGLGFHTFYALEESAASTTGTFYGSNAGLLSGEFKW